MNIRIVNSADPDQTASSLLQKQSDLGLYCLFWLFWQATSVRNFNTFTIHCMYLNSFLLFTSIVVCFLK